MKTLDTVYRFRAGENSARWGLCRVRTFVAGGKKVILLTDLCEKNDGPSVTNAIEYIIKSLLHEGIVVLPVDFIEHYEKNQPELDSFDRVTLHPSPKWESLSLSQVNDLLKEDSSSLADRSLANNDIIERADQLRFWRDPFVDWSSPMGHEEILRKLEIESSMIAKHDVQALLDDQSGEREMQRLLKRDLSIFGESYAYPHDEYICFSEFPVGNGAVDFAVFTGRSRMDVVLVEVKGSEFNLVNSNGYKEFNHKIQEAAGQIRARLGLAHRNWDAFRKHVHTLRLQAQNGDRKYNAFLGPRPFLEVDPKKDINVRAVIIGGRTRKDLQESHKRQEFERTFTIPLRVESWDTWLRRLQRA